MAKDTSSGIVPFVITGKYNMFKNRIRVEFLEKREVSLDLDSENKKLMDAISYKLEEEYECNK